MKKNIFFSIFLWLFASKTLEARELIIVSDPFPPWQFQAANGEVKGINIDILNKIAQKLDVKITFKHQHWTRAWVSVKRGQGEFVASASRKQSREAYLRYPPSDNNLWVSRYVFFTQTNNKLDIKGDYQAILDNKLSVCIVNGFSYHHSFWKAFPYRNKKDGVSSKQYVPDRRDYHPMIVSVSEPKTCFKMLNKDRVDVVISDLSIGLSELKSLRNKNPTSYNINEITHYDTTLFSKGYPLSFIKNSNYPDLDIIGERFWQEILTMQENGEYQAIVDKWLK